MGEGTCESGAGAGACCGVSTSWPPTMLVLNTDCGVPASTLTSFSSSLIFFLLLGELRSAEGEWTSCCCCTGLQLAGAWLTVTWPAAPPSPDTSQSHCPPKLVRASSSWFWSPEVCLV